MLSKKLTLDKIPHLLKDNRVLMRTDFNVPLKKVGDKFEIADTKRIVATLPSINYVLDHKAKSLVMMSHLGRPDGVAQEEFSMKPLVPAIEDLIKRKVTFLNNCWGEEVERECMAATDGRVFLLENLRFHLAEEGKGVVKGEKVKASKEDVAAFRNSLSKLGDVFVNDAFGTAHRAHSSMVGVNVETRAAGFLMAKELNFFAKVLENPTRPLTVVMGGAKVKDKIQLIMNLLDLADEIIIGGGMAFTFNHVVDAVNIGDSLYDPEGAEVVPQILAKAQAKGVKLHFPIDFVCADKFAADAKTQIRTESQGIEKGWLGLDIGPATIKNNSEVIARAKTIFWNGPQGVFEMDPFAKGSLAMLEDIIKVTGTGATSVVGGGDTVNLLKKIKGAANKLSHVSTGGGASLELVEGKQLPGVVALSDMK